MKIILTLLLCITVSTAFAEKIDGPANIRETPNGELLLSLYDGITIYPISKSGDWYKVHLLVDVNSSDYLLSTQQVKKGSLLFSAYRNINAGKAIKTITAPLSEIYSEEGAGEKLTVVIEGYTYKNNIKEKGLLEEDLEKLLKSSHPVSRHGLRAHLELFGYAKYWGKHTYFTGFTYGGDLVYDPSPTVRIIIFMCGVQLCAISHQRPISYPTWKRAEASRGLNLMFLSNFPKDRYVEFVNWYNESFARAD